MFSQNSYDAIVVGGGPSGSSSSYILSEHGHRVLLLEREKFPRYHIGESMIPFTYGPMER
ncbi:MAG: FAD-dependent oxidoreductase, partial [Verrucomicrobia bacterium]|nr:FAD-dependent oxidoreductase [Verrucomicrobiota bacterium]